MARRKTRAQTNKILDRFLDRLVFDGLPRALAVMHVEELRRELLGPDEEPVASATQPAATAPLAQARALVEQYRVLYREIVGPEDPRITQADYVMLGQLVKSYGPVMVAARMTAFARWDDKFVREKVGFTLPAFYRYWNQLATVLAAQTPQARAPADCRHNPRCPDAKTHSTKFLAEARASSRGPTWTPQPISTPSDPS